MAAGKDREVPSLSSLRREARTIYGGDAQGYDLGRPDYPGEVYDILASLCGLRAGASVLEIGAGTGLEIIRATFEQAAPGQDRFDLAVAATSFHWVDQAAGLPKLARVIRPGGWAAVWWTVFDDPGRQDAFRDALRAGGSSGRSSPRYTPAAARAKPGESRARRRRCAPRSRPPSRSSW